MNIQYIDIIRTNMILYHTLKNIHLMIELVLHPPSKKKNDKKILMFILKLKNIYIHVPIT